MRDSHSPVLMGLFVGVGLVAGGVAAPAADITARPIDKTSKSSSVVESQPTLSALGIDFGAAELLRFTELDLSGEQKEKAVHVVRCRRPEIDQLCDRMTRALGMDESTGEAKVAKREALQTVVEDFKQVQSEIVSGLHALITAEQGERLQRIKQRELDRIPPVRPVAAAAGSRR
ncbi:MAG: hypothetical protein ACR2RV_10945 [Verrucomicrobiales bacterium]